ncbi:hypothetical protein [Fimbriiglobus ruber]|uniref:Uncharacterized protein n=1 Tax=Fimbriiglobus ruber TaxID=1908690 RepID=A0A225D686_9BACT|nr:hypothetical protein [Fimbriiglobus ruber]OWK36493.1 hypothetical protein FRUB_09056 [Fimbriiglobus ruber]
MDQGPLVIDQLDAGARFLDEFQKYVPVQAAFWLKESDEGEGSLYVASDKITDDNFDVAYGEVLRIAGVLHDPHFDPFQVKLIGADDPLAKAALDVHRRYPGRTASRFYGKVFGGLPVDEVYLYSSPIPVPAT